MEITFNNLTITGITAALPQQTLDLHALTSQLGAKELKRIIANTGVESVHVARKGMHCSDLCVAAAQHLLNQLTIDPKTVDAIVFVSQTPDRIAPATSGMMQHRLGLPQSAVAFDINYGCSGYIYGLYQAALLLTAGGCKRVLVCSGDVITPLLHENSHQLRLLLGDAGTATLIEQGQDNWSITINTDGSGDQHLTAAKILPKQTLPAEVNHKGNGYYHMDGNQVMSFAMRVVPEIVATLLRAKQWQKEAVETFALHQPNTFMLNFLRKKLAVAAHTVPIAVQTVGNTGPASIPLLLAMKGQELQQNKQLAKTILCGFGVGLSWGGVALNLQNTSFFSPITLN